MGSQSEWTVPDPHVAEAYRIGSVEGGAWDSFSLISSVAFDEAGYLYVLDAEARRITIVDPEGGFVRAFGRQGDGPGELRIPRAVTVLPSGDVAVADPGQRGILLFTPEGEYLRTVGTAEGVIGGLGAIFSHGRDGIVFADSGLRFAGGGGPPTLPEDIPIRRINVSEGETTEVLHRAWRPSSGATREVRGSGGTMTMRFVGGGMTPAFEPRLHLAVLPDGRLAIADSSTYRLRIVDPDGREGHVLERDVAPRPTGERERQAERRRQLAELEEGSPGGVRITIGGGPGGGGPGGGPGMSPEAVQEMVRQMRREAIEEMEFWPEIPVVQGLMADREGRLWVERFRAVGEGGPVDVLDPDEGLIVSLAGETFSLPDAFGPAGLAAWIEMDELDIPFVRVGRIELDP
jgi:hypothetical protein